MQLANLNIGDEFQCIIPPLRESVGATFIVRQKHERVICQCTCHNVYFSFHPYNEVIRIDKTQPQNGGNSSQVTLEL